VKQLAEFLKLSLTIILTAIFFACSPMPEKTQQNGFFAPVDRIVHKTAESDTLVVIRRSDSTHADDGLKNSLIVLLQQQNNRLGDMIRQLNLLTKKNNTGNLKDTDNLGEILANRSQISNEMLLEKIKDQNQRLNDVIEQLKLLSQSQENQNENQYHLVTGANVTPVQPAQAQQFPVLITNANIDTVKPTLSQQGFVTRKPNTSLNYGKAIQLYKNREYKKAIDAFEKLLNQKIEPKLADRYHFWMGVCYLNLSKSNKAINEFTDVLGYTDSDKAEEAYFMIGQCYERIGSKKSAKMTYKKMLQMYPQGNLKQVAEKKLALLK